MIAYIFVYIFLAIALGAMLYVVGMPWTSPKALKSGRRNTRGGRPLRPH